MPKKSPPPKDQTPQHDRFKELARESRADQSGRAFEKAFEKIIPPKKG